jgi:hypothetical protein
VGVIGTFVLAKSKLSAILYSKEYCQFIMFSLVLSVIEHPLRDFP